MQRREHPPIPLLYQKAFMLVTISQHHDLKLFSEEGKAPLSCSTNAESRSSPFVITTTEREMPLPQPTIPHGPRYPNPQTFSKAYPQNHKHHYLSHLLPKILSPQTPRLLRQICAPSLSNRELPTDPNIPFLRSTYVNPPRVSLP